MKQNPEEPLSAMVAAAAKRLFMQARDIAQLDGYRAEQALHAGTRPQNRREGSRNGAHEEPELRQ